MTKNKTVKLSKRPKFPRCKTTPTSGHTSTPWTCRVCSEQACSRCAKYFWKSKEGGVEFKDGGAVMVGARVGTCGKCNK